MNPLLYKLILTLVKLWCICADLEVGIIQKETFYDKPKILTLDSFGMKSCARRCLYHKSCYAFNYHPSTLVCDLLKTGGTTENSSLSESIFSDISTWSLTNDVCHPNPCKENEECRKTKSGGYFCRQDASLCRGIECLNGGECSSEHSSFVCRCADGFQGKFCESSACDSSPCINHSTCKATSDHPGYKCNCNKGYHGINCHLNLCDNKPCKNNGLCSFEGSSFTCTCTDKYFGTTCNESICDSQVTPCGNSGNCAPLTHTSYECVCNAGHFGHRCQYNPCSPSPCHNKGNCAVAASSSSCSCKPPFVGNHCESVPCSSSTCKYGACHVGQGVCICNTGYYGIMCDMTYVTGIYLSIYRNNQSLQLGPYDAGLGNIAVVRIIVLDTQLNKDLLQIFDGSSASAPLLATRSGTNLGPDVIASGRFVFLSWTTDGSINTGTGWTFRVYKKPAV